MKEKEKELNPMSLGEEPSGMLLTRFYTMLDRVWPSREPENTRIKFVERVTDQSTLETSEVEFEMPFATFEVHENLWTVFLKRK